jgi:pimeloyl-ACP methyl ester carboxylesterase
VECTTIDAPLDHADPSKGTIALRVARHRAKRTDGGAKAIFQIAGGPGGSSVWQSGTVPRLMPKLLDNFDLVYVDQRGTGGSGYLDCRAGYPETEDEWRACAKEHTTEPLDHYLTQDAANDIDLVRERLGYGRIHLRGGSYGTRLGLEYLRLHSAKVASAVLDGLLPPDLDFMGEIAQEFTAGIDWLVDDCARDPACVAVSPNLRADLESVRAARRTTPRPISVGGSSMLEDESLFLEALEATLYDRTRFQVPRAIRGAATGDNTAWNAILSSLFGRSVSDSRGPSYVAPALWMTVVCAEYVAGPGDVARLEALESSQPWLSGRASAYARACQSWKVTPVPSERRTPVRSDAKVLLLSGGIDLITPPRWADMAAKSLPNSRHVVVPYATHSVMATPCGAQMITAFFESDGDYERLDTSCTQKVAPPAW